MTMLLTELTRLCIVCVCVCVYVSESRSTWAIFGDLSHLNANMQITLGHSQLPRDIGENLLKSKSWIPLVSILKLPHVTPNDRREIIPFNPCKDFSLFASNIVDCKFL